MSDAFHYEQEDGKTIAVIQHVGRVEMDDANALRFSHAELLAALENLLNILPSATTHPAIKTARRAVANARRLA